MVMNPPVDIDTGVTWEGEARVVGLQDHDTDIDCIINMTLRDDNATTDIGLPIVAGTTASTVTVVDGDAGAFDPFRAFLQSDASSTSSTISESHVDEVPPITSAGDVGNADTPPTAVDLNAIFAITNNDACISPSHDTDVPVPIPLPAPEPVPISHKRLNSSSRIETSRATGGISSIEEEPELPHVSGDDDDSHSGSDSDSSEPSTSRSVSYLPVPSAIGNASVSSMSWADMPWVEKQKSNSNSVHAQIQPSFTSSSTTLSSSSLSSLLPSPDTCLPPSGSPSPAITPRDDLSSSSDISSQTTSTSTSTSTNTSTNRMSIPAGSTVRPVISVVHSALHHRITIHRASSLTKVNTTATTSTSTNSPSTSVRTLTVSSSSSSQPASSSVPPGPDSLSLPRSSNPKSVHTPVSHKEKGKGKRTSTKRVVSSLSGGKVLAARKDATRSSASGGAGSVAVVGGSESIGARFEADTGITAKSLFLALASDDNDSDNNDGQKQSDCECECER
jgi:hypothetical protein